MKTEWFYCIHCERAFTSDVPDDWQPPVFPPAGQLGVDEFGDLSWKCPYEGCNGHEGDIWDWAGVREEHPGYPKEPELGKVYPLYES